MNGYTEGQMIIITTEHDALRVEAEHARQLSEAPAIALPDGWLDDPTAREPQSQLSMGPRSLGAAAAADTSKSARPAAAPELASVAAACSGRNHCGESAAAA